MFGKLIVGKEEENGDKKKTLEPADSMDGDHDLKEHMVGILFSRSKLSHLQKQVLFLFKVFSFLELNFVFCKLSIAVSKISCWKIAFWYVLIPCSKKYNKNIDIKFSVHNTFLE